MAARTIVTSHPDVACDVCGRRLLRGEHPNVFLGGGQRRLVCELCTPRATHEGWRRETEAHTARPRPERSQRGRSLLGKLRQSRWSIADRSAPPERAGAEQMSPGEEMGPSEESETPVAAQWTELGAEWTAVDEEWAETHPSAAPTADEAPGEAPREVARAAVDRTAGEGANASVRRALEVFNAGEYPRRVAGVARSLGAPSVRASQAAGTNVAIVVAWELCWYRYEIDLGDEARGARLTAEGMELAKLPGEDRIANAAADERGTLSLLDP